MSQDNNKVNKNLWILFAAVAFAILVLIAYLLCGGIIKRFLIILICEIVLGLCAFLIYNIASGNNKSGKKSARQDSDEDYEDTEDDEIDYLSESDETDENDSGYNEKPSFTGSFRIDDDLSEYVFKRTEENDENTESNSFFIDDIQMTEPEDIQEEAIAASVQENISEVKEDIPEEEAEADYDNEYMDVPIESLFKGIDTDTADKNVKTESDEPKKSELFSGELFKGQLEKASEKAENTGLFQGAGYRSPFQKKSEDEQ